jgi:hypothetical protein
VPLYEPHKYGVYASEPVSQDISPWLIHNPVSHCLLNDEHDTHNLEMHLLAIIAMCGAWWLGEYQLSFDEYIVQCTALSCLRMGCGPMSSDVIIYLFHRNISWQCRLSSSYNFCCPCGTYEYSSNICRHEWTVTFGTSNIWFAINFVKCLLFLLPQQY